MKSAWLKDTLREIVKSFNRFFSIFAIVMLGVGFFVGVKATSPDMKLTADQYFQNQSLMDLHLRSTLGFNDKDMARIKAMTGYTSMIPTYAVDALADVDGNSLVIKIMALPDSTDAVGDTLNKPMLVEGRMPQNPGECVVEPNQLAKPWNFALGETITFRDKVGDDSLSDFLMGNTFTVVGFAESPLYISYDRGSSPIGDGTVRCFIMVPREAFQMDVYTDVFLKAASLRGLSGYSAAYTGEVDRLVSQLEDLGHERSDLRYDEIMTEANGDIADGKQKIADAEKEKDEKLGKAQKDIADGKQKVADAEKEKDEKLAQAQRDIDEAKKKIAQSEIDLANARQKYNTDVAKAEQDLAQGKADYEKAKADYDKNKAEYDEAKDLPTKIYNLKADLEGLGMAIFERSARVNADDPELVRMQADFDKKKQELSDLQEKAQKYQSTGSSDSAGAEQKLADAKKELDDSKAKLDESEQTLNTEKKDAQAKISNAQQQIASAKVKLAQGEADYEKGKTDAEQKIADAKADITQGEADYEAGKADAEQKIAGAQADIEAAERDLADLKKPKWYVNTRKDNPGYSDYEENADRINAVASVFPVFFLLVAAMVCLTTMTRMVEEQRTQIGTLKALGYSRAAIAGKYCLYAVLASLLGSVAGIAIGLRLFPRVIYGAYDILYNLPPIVITFQWTDAIVSTLIAVLCTAAVALFACYGELISPPAMLMRPRAPKAGKRIFLERIRFLWKRMGFISKVTARNLLRYKARFLMTVLGIAGCAALMVAGFGLRDSISIIVPRQFDDLYAYDIILGLTDETAQKDLGPIAADLAADKRIERSLIVRQKVMDAAKGREKAEIHLLVPEKPEELNIFIKLRHRADGSAAPMSKTGVLITEKLARLLGVSVGDTISLQEAETTVEVPVADIVENYVFHYVYMDPELYRSLFHEEPLYNSVIGNMAGSGAEFEKQIATDWLARDDIFSLNFTTSISDTFSDSIASLNTVVLVMIISAGCLAFVVLYNLTNINICERIREIATIKVLGFYNAEVSNYVYRENFVLTIIGSIIGLIAGIFLHRYVVTNAEVDMVMFGRNIEPLSFVYAAVLTFAFSLFVNFVMYFRLRDVSMVESLKSVE